MNASETIIEAQVTPGKVYNFFDYFNSDPRHFSQPSYYENYDLARETKTAADRTEPIPYISPADRNRSSFVTAKCEFHTSQSMRKTELTARGVAKASSAEPIMSYYDYMKVCDQFLSSGKFVGARDYAMFVTGVATGLRVSDVCLLKTTDVFAREDHFQKPWLTRLTFLPVIDIVEKKTHKRTVSNVDEVIVTEALRLAIAKYLIAKGAVEQNGCLVIKTRDQNEYLFSSAHGGFKPLDESLVYRNITNAIKAANIGIHAGTHTMRKTFLNIANAIGSQSKLMSASATALADCQILARHSSTTTTLKYMNAVKGRILSLRNAVSDFLLGRTAIKELSVSYDYELDDE